MKKRIVMMWSWVTLLIFVMSILTGCQLKKVDEKKLKDLEYTVCDEGSLPKELVNIIDEKKKEPFKLTYRTKDFMFIVVGYGLQKRSDIGVSMKELYLTGNTIFVDTQLVVTKKSELGSEIVTYPYIAVKCPLHEEEVRFK